MRASRGMGCINPSKVPKKITRKDNPNEVDMYRKGGRVKQPQENRIVSIDRLSKQAKSADSVGKKLTKWNNLGSLSAFK